MISGEGSSGATASALRGTSRAPVVHVVIGCDTDPDRELFVGSLPPDRLQWRGMLEGIPALKESVRGLLDDAGREPAFTWLVRADEQVRALEGSYAWVVEAHGAALDALRASGDEIGWHPHFWRLDPASGPSSGTPGIWYQEIEDGAWQIRMLEEAYAALGRAGLTPQSVRMGWDYHDNATISALDRLGVRLDFSALPGLRTFSGRPPRRGENLYDWHRAPEHAYQPSRTDYQRAGRSGESSLGLIELPIAVTRSRKWGLAAGAQLARKTRTLRPLWDALRRPRYVMNLTAKPVLFLPLIQALQHTLQGRGRTDPAFATYFHADELLPNRTIYGMHHIRENLQALLAVIHRAGATASFVTANEFASHTAELRSTDS